MLHIVVLARVFVVAIRSNLLLGSLGGVAIFLGLGLAGRG